MRKLLTIGLAAYILVTLPLLAVMPRLASRAGQETEEEVSADRGR